MSKTHVAKTVANIRRRTLGVENVDKKIDIKEAATSGVYMSKPRACKKRRKSTESKIQQSTFGEGN